MICFYILYLDKKIMTKHEMPDWLKALDQANMGSIWNALSFLLPHRNYARPEYGASVLDQHPVLKRYIEQYQVALSKGKDTTYVKAMIEEYVIDRKVKDIDLDTIF